MRRGCLLPLLLLLTDCSFDRSGLTAGDAWVGDQSTSDLLSPDLSDADTDAITLDLLLSDSGDLNTGDGGSQLTPLAQDDGRLWLGLKAAAPGGPLSVWTYTASLGTWSVETSSPPLTGDPFYVTAVPPLPGSLEEAVVVKAVVGKDLVLTALRHAPPLGWVTDFTHTETDKSRKSRLDYDLAREGVSKELLLVHSDGTNLPVYRTFSAGVWSSPMSLPSGPGKGGVLWVALIERPGSDEIALLYADDQADLSAVIWDGASWDLAGAKLLESNLKVNPILKPKVVGNRVFDGAYEHGSGTLLVAWGKSDGKIGYATRPGGGSWTTGTPFGVVSGMVEFVDLAAEPESGSKRIAAAFVDMGNSTERLGLGVWDGSSWTGAREYDQTIHDVNDKGTGDFPAAVGWVKFGGQGEAVCVYADKESGNLDWLFWTANDWQMGQDLKLAGKGVTESVVLRQLRGRDELMAIISDSSSQVYAATFDGWIWTAGAGTLTGSLAHTDSVPFSFTVQP